MFVKFHIESKLHTSFYYFQTLVKNNILYEITQHFPPDIFLFSGT